MDDKSSVSYQLFLFRLGYFELEKTRGHYNPPLKLFFKQCYEAEIWYTKSPYDNEHD